MVVLVLELVEVRLENIGMKKVSYSLITILSIANKYFLVNFSMKTSYIYSMKNFRLHNLYVVFLFPLFLLSVNSNAQLNEIIPQNCISQKHDHSKHTCGKKRLPEEPVWVDPPEKSGSINKSLLANATAYTQSIHNAIAKWDVGSCQSFSFGTTPGGNDIRWGQALST